MVDSNTRFVTKILYENNGAVYGLEVLLFDINDEVIDKILVVDETSFDGLSEYVTNLSDAYVPFSEDDVANLESLKSEREKIGKVQDGGDTYTYEDYSSFKQGLEWSSLKSLGSLENILKNDDKNTNIFPVEINATKLQGHDIEDISLRGHTHNYSEKNHSYADRDYGVGTEKLYGHVKLVDNLNATTFMSGEALSSYQGRVLNDKITSLETKNEWLPVVKPNNYLSYKVNPDLRLVVCNYNRNDYTGLKSKTGAHELHGAGTIPNAYAPSGRVSIPMYRGDVVLYYKTDGSVNIYNLTKVKSMSLYGQVIWHY